MIKTHLKIEVATYRGYCEIWPNPSSPKIPGLMSYAYGRQRTG